MNKTTHPIEPDELMAYLDGELSSDGAAAAAAHLSECGECREVVSILRGVSQSMKDWDIRQSESQIPQAIEIALTEGDHVAKKVVGRRRGWRSVFRDVKPALAWVGVLAALVLTLVGTVRLIGGNANNVFSTVAENFKGQAEPQNDSRSARPAPTGEVVGGLQMRQSAELVVAPSPPQGGGGGAADSIRIARRETNLPTPTGPMIIRTAQLSLITKEFDKARANVEAILKRHRGYVAELKVGGSAGSGRTLTATLRVPADQLDASLTELKTLGRVESESQSGQDITSQYVDLQARLGNARNTEQRLTELLRQRTGKLSDVLEVEQEVDRVRGEIEQMEAERKTMSNQVSFATLNATITEDYKAQLQVVPPSTSTRLSNAAVEGYKSMVDGIVGLALFLLENGPTLLLWGAILFFPARLVWKKVRRGFAH
jgi:hypothetical protein